MQKKNNKSLALKTQTIRSLQEEMRSVGGGTYTYTYGCLPPTQAYTCHLKTPGCPM